MQRRQNQAGRVPVVQQGDWRARWDAMKAAIVADAWRQLMREPYRRLYLYHTAAVGPVWGTFHLVPESGQAPADTWPVAGESVPAGDQATIARWLERYASRLPMIGDERLAVRILQATYLQVRPVCPECGHRFSDATRSEIDAHIVAAHV